MKLVLAALLLLSDPFVDPLVGQVAVHGKVVFTMEGEPLLDGTVVVENGKIAAIGKRGEVAVPAGFRELSASVVTPGLIDARSTVGLTGWLNQAGDQDQSDATEPIQPELRAIDAYNGNDRLIEWLRGFGITTVHTGHAPGPLVSGQTFIVKTKGGPADDAVLSRCAMIAATLGDAREGKDKKRSPGTRAKAASLLRAELTKAKAWREKMARADGEKPEPNLRLEALARVLAREIPLLVTAQRQQDILTALRIAKEFDLRLVLDGGAEAWTLIPELKAAGIPVIVHPPMARPAGELENATLETAARLHAAGIPIALESGFESYVPKVRVVLFEAAAAAANGLTHRDALAAITIDAAKLLGVDARIGSIATGKDGDLALYDGDPFEYTTHCVGVVIEGVVVHSGR